MPYFVFIEEILTTKLVCIGIGAVEVADAFRYNRRDFDNKFGV